MRQVRLVATDLDGTLLGNGETEADYTAFRLRLEGLRRQAGAVWAAMTGRHLASAFAALDPLAAHGLEPEYLVVEDALVYRRLARTTYMPFRWWNLTVQWRRRALQWRYRRRLGNWRARVLREHPGSQVLLPERTDLWVRLSDPAAAEQVAAGLRAEIGAHEPLLVFRWQDEVYAGPLAGTKGEALSRIGREVGSGADTTFAVGDGPNDVSMLCGVPARLSACVRNATADVHQAVRGAGGYEAQADGLRGVIEALDAYTDPGTAARAPHGRPAASMGVAPPS